MGDVYWGVHSPLAAIAATAGIRTAVETGTFYGTSALQLAALFARVVTIEANPELVEFCRSSYASVGRIEFVHGESGHELQEILRRIDDPCFIFLDAHWFPSAPFQSGLEHQCPILRELQAVRAVGALQRGSVVVIDDSDMFLGSLPSNHFRREDFPSIAQILRLLKEDLGAEYVDVFDDVIVAGPHWMSSAVELYHARRGKLTGPSSKRVQV